MAHFFSWKKEVDGTVMKRGEARERSTKELGKAEEKNGGREKSRGVAGVLGCPE